MFDFAWSELGVIGLVAVVVLGPKELPQAMRALGRFTRQARRMAGEFQTHVNDLIREAELEDIKKSVDQVTTVNVGAEIDKLLDPELDQSLAEAQRDLHTAMNAPVLPPAVKPASPTATSGNSP